MRIIAVEEHFVTRAVREAWARLDPAHQDDSLHIFDSPELDARLEDLSEARVREMDAIGIDVQVLSLTTPGLQNLDADAAVREARQVNDLIAATVQSRPDRFEGFAALPTAAPKDAARELGRAVSELGLRGAMLFGRTRERNMDHPDFLPIYQEAARLRVPIYVHPQTPQEPVRDALYSGLGGKLDLYLATGGFGWHVETGIQLLRLILSGTFDRLPDLQVILGHWGEVVLFYLERASVLAAAPELRRPIADYVRHNVHVSPSGILSPRYLSWAIEVVGIDRILFSIDHPYQKVAPGDVARFFAESGLDEADRNKIAHGNWERLRGR